MENPQVRFLPLAAKAAVCHTLTYFLMGILAFNLLHYAELMANPANGMRPATDPLILAGPLFQPLRGVLFALVFFPLRSLLFGRRHGWLLMSWILIAIGILGTFAAAPGSIEGAIYTTTPLWLQMRGWLEVVPQAILLSALLCYWVDRPEKKWLTWTLSIAFVLVMAMSVLGLLLPRR
ncbi:MAG: hypothetical protein WCE75_03220 [Terracidiphilus sp.]